MQYGAAALEGISTGPQGSPSRFFPLYDFGSTWRYNPLDRQPAENLHKNPQLEHDAQGESSPEKVELERISLSQVENFVKHFHFALNHPGASYIFQSTNPKILNDRMQSFLVRVLEQTGNSKNSIATSVKKAFDLNVCEAAFKAKHQGLYQTLLHGLSLWSMQALEPLKVSYPDLGETFSVKYYEIMAKKIGVQVAALQPYQCLNHFDYSLYHVNCQPAILAFGAHRYGGLDSCVELCMGTVNYQEHLNWPADRQAYDLVFYGCTNSHGQWVPMQSGFVTDTGKVRSFYPGQGKIIEHELDQFSSDSGMVIRVFRRDENASLCKYYEDYLTHIGNHGAVKSDYDQALENFKEETLSESARGKQDLLWAKKLHARRVAPCIPLPAQDNKELDALADPVEQLAKKMGAVDIAKETDDSAVKKSQNKSAAKKAPEPSRHSRKPDSRNRRRSRRERTPPSSKGQKVTPKSNAPKPKGASQPKAGKNVRTRARRERKKL